MLKSKQTNHSKKRRFFIRYYIFIIGILNYNENLTQGDKQELMHEIDNKISLVLDKVQKHLEIQDKQLNIIIKRLEELEIDR